MNKWAYYNEIDPFAAQWIRELIKAGHVTDGEVDERSIEDVLPTDVMGFSRCHFFSGVAVWDYALNQTGYDRWDTATWTGSCPCQPFSAAGKGGGTSDERHLWPSFFWLIRQCRPDVVFGEQVEAALRHDWLDHVAVDLEAEGYTVGAVNSPACGYGAPHIRQRLYWVAHSEKPRGREQSRAGDGTCKAVRPKINNRRTAPQPNGVVTHSPTRSVADAEHAERRAQGNGRNDFDAEETGRQQGDVLETTGPGPTNGFWRNAEWIPCRDGKARPTGRGIHPLVGKLEYTKRSGLICSTISDREPAVSRWEEEQNDNRVFSKRCADENGNGPTQSSPIALATRTPERVVCGCDKSLCGNQEKQEEKIDEAEIGHKAGPSQGMLNLRGVDATEKNERAVGGFGSVQPQKILRSEVYGNKPDKGNLQQPESQQEKGARFGVDGLLRELWDVEEGEKSSRSSQRQEPTEQQAGKPDNALLFMPSEGAFDPNNTAIARVMRLRGFGNCIVGPQAAAFVKAYMAVAQ